MNRKHKKRGFYPPAEITGKTVFTRKIDEITVHNTETDADVPLENTIATISRSHERRFWENVSCKGVDVAYHYLISKDWTIVQTRCLDEIGWHNSKNNLTSIWVALIGNFNKTKPTKEQYEALDLLLDVLKTQFTWAVVKPHRGRWASCPWKLFDQTQIWIQEKTNKIWEYVLSRYYSPEPNQTEYFNWAKYDWGFDSNWKEYCKKIADKGWNDYGSNKCMNCWVWSCKTTATTTLTNDMIWKIWACPQWLKWKHIQIDMWFGKQDFYCADVGSAIIGNRLDIWAGYGEEWYWNIKNWVVKNTGSAKIYIVK